MRHSLSNNYKEIEQFYQDNYNRLVKILTHRAGSPENAEDVIQESFTRAMTYWSSFDPERQELGAWFNTIMNNTLRTYKRDERSGGTFVELEEEHHESFCLSETNQDTIQRIKDAIASKSGDDRDILDLYFLKQFKPREIMCVVETNNKRISYLVNQFKLEMQDLFEEDYV